MRGELELKKGLCRGVVLTWTHGGRVVAKMFHDECAGTSRELTYRERKRERDRGLGVRSILVCGGKGC